MRPSGSDPIRNSLPVWYEVNAMAQRWLRSQAARPREVVILVAGGLADVVSSESVTGGTNSAAAAALFFVGFARGFLSAMRRGLSAVSVQVSRARLARSRL